MWPVAKCLGCAMSRCEGVQETLLVVSSRQDIWLDQRGASMSPMSQYMSSILTPVIGIWMNLVSVVKCWHVEVASLQKFLGVTGIYNGFGIEWLDMFG